MIPRSSEPPKQPSRLDTWKSIAEYLGRSCRTVQRWHEQFGMPVRRLGGKSGSAFAFTNELDAWMRSQGEPAVEVSSPDLRHVLVHGLRLMEEAGCSDEAPNVIPVRDPSQERSAVQAAEGWRMWTTLSIANLRGIACHFRSAIDLDPGNVEGWAGLSMISVLQGFLGSVSAQSAYTSAQAALQRALDLDPGHPVARSAASWLAILIERDWPDAICGFDELIRRRPCAVHDLIGRAVVHVASGFFQDASSLFLQATRQHPLSTPPAEFHCWSEYLAGNYARALDILEDTRNSGRSGPVLDSIDALATLQIEGPAASVRHIEALVAESPHNSVLRGVLGYANAMAGQSQNAHRVLDALTDPSVRDRGQKPYSIALILTGLREQKQAVHFLEQAWGDGSMWSFALPFDPILAPLRKDEHFMQFLLRTGNQAAVAAGLPQEVAG